MILAGAQDTGPMNYLLALSSHLKRTVRWVAEGRGAALLAERGLSADADWLDTPASLVLTGTALGSSLDKDLVDWAARRGVPSVSVVEHWSWYRKRFELEGGLRLPDRIIVNDAAARDQAVAQGLPPRRLFVGGNPVLERLASQEAPALDRAAWRAKHGLQAGPLVVFVSESLRESFPPGSPDYLGYDEYGALRGLLDALPAGWSLAIKPHPEEPPGKYRELRRAHDLGVIGAATPAELAQGAEIIVGMASMLLLELSLFRRDIISFRPGAKGSFIGEELGALTGAKDADGLAALLRRPPRAPEAFGGRFRGSGERIARFLESLAA